MTEISPTPSAMKKAIDLRRPATTMPLAYAGSQVTPKPRPEGRTLEGRWGRRFRLPSSGYVVYRVPAIRREGSLLRTTLQSSKVQHPVTHVALSLNCSREFPTILTQLGRGHHQRPASAVGRGNRCADRLDSAIHG